MSEHSIKCKTPECEKAGLSYRRGLCVPCYWRLSRQVKKGKLSWEQLEKEGKVNPSSKKKKDGWAWGKNSTSLDE